MAMNWWRRHWRMARIIPPDENPTSSEIDPEEWGWPVQEKCLKYGNQRVDKGFNSLAFFLGRLTHIS
jgi:hypothetical protein